MEGVLKKPDIKKPDSKLIRVLLISVAGLFIFQLGIGVGSGRINFNNQTARNSQNSGLPNDLDYSSVEDIYDLLRSNYDGQLDGTKVLDGIKEGLAESTGDPYTEYLNKAAAQEFNNELNGTFSGIGAELSKDKDAIVVVSPIAGFPAEKAGLKPRDIIVEIDGQSALQLSLSEAVSKIRGEKGTTVKLKVIRDQKQELTFDIVRDTITIPSVESEILEGNIGYLKITRFAEDTTSLSTEAANKFKAANVKGVILDVRGDPGGLLDASIDISSLWLPAGKTVLQEKRGEVVVKTYRSKGPGTLQGIPTIVLINAGSASASEITAGALKDNGAATLYGTKSYGKGSVQQLQRLQDGGVLKVTIARWYTPSGKNIDKEGIEPDTKIERSDEDVANNRDPQKDKALETLKR